MSEIKQSIIRLLTNVDSLTSRARLAMFPEGGSLVTLLFHGLFLDASELDQNVVLPGQRMTVAYFEQFLRCFKNAGYRFVSPQDCLNGLDLQKKSIMITFDDGYFSNQMALAALEKHEVPAVFFIATKYVQNQRCFWWDVLFRELHQRGVMEKDIALRIESMKSRTVASIEEDICDSFGSNCFEPIGDTDRPFASNELTAFAQHPLVHIGNHTHTHDILTNLDYEGAKSTIEKANHLLNQWTGKGLISFRIQMAVFLITQKN